MERTVGEVATIKFKGVVEAGDSCRCDDERSEGSVLVGGVDVVKSISKLWDTSTKVIVGIGDERFSGDLALELGWGYSEWTPMDSDTLKVGDHDLIEIILSRFKGKEIQMWVSDEPINVLEDYPIQGKEGA